MSLWFLVRNFKQLFFMPMWQAATQLLHVLFKTCYF